MILIVRYSACNIDCQRQLVASRCGLDAQRLVQDMVQLSVNSVELLSDSVGFPFTMPSECRNIENNYTPTPSVGSAPAPYAPTFSPNSIQGPQTFYQNQRYHHSQGFAAPSQDYWQQMRGYQLGSVQNPSYTDNVHKKNNSPFFNPANDNVHQQQRHYVNGK